LSSLHACRPGCQPRLPARPHAADGTGLPHRATRSCAPTPRSTFWIPGSPAAP